MRILTLVAYNLLFLLLTPLAIGFIIWELIISDKSRHGMGERLGFISGRKLQGAGPRVWVHAVSVGETVAAKPIWEALLQVLPEWTLFHSTTTDTGRSLAEKQVGDRGRLIYFPFDFLPCVWLSLSRVRPDLIILMETELWPNFLALAKLMHIPVMVVNGCISDRSLRGGQKIGWIYRWMTGHIDRFCMQTAQDAERIISLGADPARVTVVGNSKFDQVMTKVTLGEQVKLRDALHLQRDEPVVIAGSTHPGEEEVVLRAFRQLTSTHPEVRLLIAPRDIQRAQKLEELVTAHGFAVVRRSKIDILPPPPDAVIIMDTIGELAKAYALSTCGFVGGSLVPVGGHNVLEPVALGKPALFGPHMEKQRDLAALVQQAGVGLMVHSAEDLAEQWQHFLTNPDACRALAATAKKLIKSQTGVSKKYAEEAIKVLA